MKSVKIIVLIFILLSFGECDNNPVAVKNATLNTDFNMSYRITVYIAGENLSIYFADLVEESRCPEGADCIWEGNAKIKLIIRKNGSIEKIDTVQTYLPQSIVSIGEINNSYLFWVKKVSPYPQINRKIDTSKYVLTLNVTQFTYGFSYNKIENKTGIFGQTYISPKYPHTTLGYINYAVFPNQLFQIVNEKSDTTDIFSDRTGRFIKYLSPGEYHIVPRQYSSVLYDTSTYIVKEGKMNFISINYFSGKR